MHFIEMIVIVALVIAIVFLIRLLYKGRPSCDKQNTKSQDKKTPNNAPNMSTMYQQQPQLTFMVPCSLKTQSNQRTYGSMEINFRE